MSNRLFIGNLGYSTSEQELRDVFAPYGAIVDVTIVSDRITGQSRGFGFVELESASDISRAIRELDGSLLAGRNIKVSEARERTGGGRGTRGSSGSNHDRW